VIDFTPGNYACGLVCCASVAFDEHYPIRRNAIYQHYGVVSQCNFRQFSAVNATSAALWNLLWEFTGSQGHHGVHGYK